MENRVYEKLDALGIGYIAYQHKPSPTVEHVAELDQSIRGRHCKNLFLKNSKADQLFLLIAPYDKPVDLKRVARILGTTRLSFAEAETMMRYLGLEPGAVSPFGLINDAAHVVRVLVDAALQEYEFINFHPNVNTATVSMAFCDFELFLNQTGNAWDYIVL